MIQSYKLAIVTSIVLICILAYKYSSLQISNPSIVFNESNNDRLMQINENDEMVKVKYFYNQIASREKKVYSQNNEDGVIEALHDSLNLKENANKFYVEIGAGTADARECNSRYLREVKGWKGVMFDGTVENSSIPLYKTYILASNVVQLFTDKNIPIDMDFLSEDTDYGDYWIMESIMTKYRPKIVCHEINQQAEKCVTTPKTDELKIWDGSNYHGASVCAFKCLAERYGYSVVYCESAGVNCFWVRNDLIEKNLHLNVKILQKTLTPAFLSKKPIFKYFETGKVWHEIKC